MNLCQPYTDLSTEVADFLSNCIDVKEESVTDYLVWKWSKLDAKFKHININTFTRQQENQTTGADYELEFWLIGKSFKFHLVIQAKKFIKDCDAYRSKLNYVPKPSKKNPQPQKQLDKLLGYAKGKGILPFYIFYTVPDKSTQVKCGQGSQVKLQNTGVFMVDAYSIKNFANKPPRTIISKNQLLKESHPFHCIFCCPLAPNNKCFLKHFRNLSNSLSIPENIHLPNYVQLLLNNQTLEMNSYELATLIEQNELHTYRHVAVYDMRNID